MTTSTACRNKVHVFFIAAIVTAALVLGGTSTGPKVGHDSISLKAADEFHQRLNEKCREFGVVARYKGWLSRPPDARGLTPGYTSGRWDVIPLELVALAAIGAAIDGNASAIEGSVLQRGPAAFEAVDMGALIGFGNWATDKAVAEVRRWLDEDVSADYKGSAAMALAVSGRCDKQCRIRIEALLADARDNIEDSALCICFAYALALVDGGNADKWWRIIAETYARRGNHANGYVLDMVLVSLPLRQIESIRRVCRDSDPVVASAAEEILEAARIAGIAKRD